MLVKLNIRDDRYRNVETLLQGYTDKFKYCVYEENYIFKVKLSFVYHFLQGLYTLLNNKDNQIYPLLFDPIEFVVGFKGSVMHISVYDNYRE